MHLLDVLNAKALTNGLVKDVGLDRETMTAFGSTCANHCTTTTGLHANQKAMCPFATHHGGLESPFHFNSPKEEPLIVVET
ncbi:hypothetical protein MCEMSEM47_02219 [Burkholderiales bacterium]|jgi:hypothetical protein